MSDLSYCARQVRDHDNDRFLCALFAPEQARQDLMALYAFNLELAKVRETVSEPLIGRMRLQFWRDAVPEIAAGTPPAHEVATALTRAYMANGLTSDELNCVIDAREADLDELPPQNMDLLVAYAEQTSSTVIAMTLRILGVDPAPYEAAVRDAGIAVALVGLVRAIPYQASTGRVTLPVDLCQAAGLDPAQPNQWPRNPDVRRISQPILARASAFLMSARQGARGMPRAGLPALLPLSLAALYLRRLNAVDGDPKRFNERPPALARHVTLMWRSVLGRP